MTDTHPNGTTPVDPKWAWSPYQPSAERPWNRRMAAHLFRRAGFGADLQQLDQAVEMQPVELVSQIVDAPSDETRGSTDSEKPSDPLAEAVLASNNPRQLSAWWVYRLFQTRQPLQEMMTLFWHGHFATSADKVKDARAMYVQNQLLRRYALGDFRAMVHGISRDPAMLIYLDSTTNRKRHPNENYARELMELFCLGEGQYTERDVQELARCFTGWEIRQARFRFNRYQHDSGIKQILGRKDAFPDGGAIDLILDQPPGTRFIARKLIRALVLDEPNPGEDLVEPLARQLQEEAWDIGKLVKRILSSNLFFSEHSIGKQIRSPVSLTIGLLRSLNATTNAELLARELDQLGQGLFFPPNVKGWDGGRTWINASTLLGRANVMGRLLRDEDTRFNRGDLETYFRGIGADSLEDIVDLAEKLLLAVPLPRSAHQRLIAFGEETGGTPSQRIAKTLHALAASPEFQLG